MKTSIKGYLRNSPDVNKPQNIIEGGDITMKGVDFKVHGIDNNGYAKVMVPGNDYKFPNAKYVTETPIKNNKQMYSPFNKKFCGKSPLKALTGGGEPKIKTEQLQEVDLGVVKKKKKDAFVKNPYYGMTRADRVRERTSSGMIPEKWTKRDRILPSRLKSLQKTYGPRK